MKAETINQFKLKALVWVLIIAAPLCSMGQEISEAEKEEIKALNQKRMELYHEGKFDEAILYAEKVLVLQEKRLGKEHRDVAESLDDLAVLFRDTGQYAKAELLNKRALKIREAIVEKNHPSIALSFYHLAFLYRQTGKYSEAEKLFKESIEIREMALEKDYPNIARSLSGLALLYITMGRYAEAEPLLKRALEIRERVLDKDHPDIAWSINNFGWLYFKTGRYAEAELSYKKALEMRERVAGKNHPDVARMLHNLGWLYNSTGRYVEAEPLHKRGLEIREKTLRKDHPDIASSLNDLAWLYYTMRRYKEAEPLFKRALEIREKASWKDHPSSAAILNNMARLYMDTKRYGEAEEFHRKALAIREKILGKNHPDLAQSLNNLALLYFYMGRYWEAERYHKRSLEIRERALGKDHPYVAMCLRDLAHLYAATGRHGESHQFFRRGLSIMDKKRENVFSVLSEKQKLNYMQDIKGNINAFLTHTALHLSSDASAVTDTFDVWIRWKGAVLEAQGRYMDAVMHSENPEIEKKFDELTQVRRDIARHLLSRPDPEALESYFKKLGALEQKKELIETELSRLSKDFGLEKIVGEADVRRIAEILPRDSVYLDFAMVRQYDFKKKRSGPPRYFAFLLIPGKEPIVKLINIQATGKIDQLVQDYLMEMSKVKLSQEPPNINVLRNGAKALYELVIQPVGPYLMGRKRLFVSPDGMLNLIPFEIFTTPEGRYLMEDYVINYVTAGRDIVRFQDTTVAKGGALIVADPDYDLGVKEKDRVVGELKVAKALRGNVSKDAKGLNFMRLPDTKLEADNIERILREKYGGEVRNYQDKKALEEILFSKESPKVLHLATHGYFLRDEEAKEVLGQGFDLQEMERAPGMGIENPMLRSGIVLAGVNASLREGRDDGMVSAEKILGLRLKGTEMVVLSACETGVGDVRSGEGVFGLRRAFILSGARTVVMSLWGVPSRETTELMTRFYTLIAEGKTKAEALREAKLDMMQKKRNPFYWGAFVLVGKPE